MSISRAHIQVTENGTSLATKKFATLGATAKASSAEMTKLASSVKLLVGAYIGFKALGSAVTVIKQFDTTMLEVKAVTKATAEEFGRLQQAARDMGASTRYAASEAGEALLALSRAGFSTNEAISALPATLSLAIAGVLELGVAADLTAITIRQFGMNANEAERVADILVNTANSTTQTVSDMGEAMKYAGSVAGAMGISIEETAAAIGTLANAGIRGSMGGTNLRNMLLALAAPTEKSTEALNSLGLTFADIDLKTHTIQESFKALYDAGMTSTEAMNIFNKRAVAGALTMAKYSSTIGDLTEANRKATGSAKEAAETMDSGLNAAMLILKSTVEELMLRLGDAGLKGGLQKLVESFTEGIKILFGFKDALAESSTAGKVFAGVLGGIASLTIVTTLKYVLSLVKTIGIALKVAALSNPFGVALVAIVAITGALYALRESLVSFGGHTFKLKQIFTGLWYVVTEGSKIAWEYLKRFGSYIKESLAKPIEEIKTAWTNFINFLSTINITIDLSMIKQFANDMINTPIAITRAFLIAFASIPKILNNFLSNLTTFGAELGKHLYLWSENIGKWNKIVWDAIIIGFEKGKSPQDTGRIIGQMLSDGFSEAEWTMPTIEIKGLDKTGKQLGKDVLKLQSDVVNAMSDQMATDLLGNLGKVAHKSVSLFKTGFFVKPTLIPNKSDGDTTSTVIPELDVLSLQGKEEFLENLKETTKEANEIMDIFSSNISQSLGDLFTGVEVSFGSFLQSLTAQIIRTMTNQMVAKFFGMMGGSDFSFEFSNAGISGGAGDLSLGAWTNSGGLNNRAFGGTYDKGTPLLMNEYGKGEIDIPSHDGRVLNRQDAMKSAGGSSQPQNITILNNVDESVVLSAMNTTKGERFIVNIMSKYKNLIGK